MLSGQQSGGVIDNRNRRVRRKRQMDGLMCDNKCFLVFSFTSEIEVVMGHLNINF